MKDVPYLTLGCILMYLSLIARREVVSLRTKKRIESPETGSCRPAMLTRFCFYLYLMENKSPGKA